LFLEFGSAECGVWHAVLLEIELRSVPYAPPQTAHEVVNFVVTWG
jgi:hypothetical protein